VLRAPGAATSQKRRRREDQSMIAIKPSAVLAALSEILRHRAPNSPTMSAGFSA
jgi:hypothetical protein